MYKGITEAHSLKNCCGGKDISIAYSEGVFVALLIQHEKSMRPIVFSSVASLDLPRFLHYLTNGTIFGKTLVNIKRAF